jgi:hypothetical protein
MTETILLGDVVKLADGRRGLVIDIDPEDRNALLVESVHVHDVRVGRDRIEMVERASLLRRVAMRLKAFALKVRDCGLRYALA